MVPAWRPVAANPEAGYKAAEITVAGYLSGTAYTADEYSDFTDTAVFARSLFNA